MKDKYQKPAIEIILVENEGIMALSNYTEGGGAMPNRASTGRQSKVAPHNTSSMQELEDLINDILTVN